MALITGETAVLTTDRLQNVQIGPSVGLTGLELVRKVISRGQLE